jgi:hypothetical protein
VNTDYAQESKLFDNKDWFFFQRTNGVLQRAIGKGETSHILYEFHDGFCGCHFAEQILVEKIL